MKSKKSEGGVPRSGSTPQDVLYKCIYSIHATRVIYNKIETFWNLQSDSLDQYVEWFTLHNPSPTTNSFFITYAIMSYGKKITILLLLMR